MRKFVIAAAMALGVVCGFGASSQAMPSASDLMQATSNTEATSPVIQVDGRCGRFRHYVPRHHYHGRMIGGVCARN